MFTPDLKYWTQIRQIHSNDAISEYLYLAINHGLATDREFHIYGHPFPCNKQIPVQSQQNIVRATLGFWTLLETLFSENFEQVFAHWDWS